MPANNKKYSVIKSNLTQKNNSSRIFIFLKRNKDTPNKAETTASEHQLLTTARISVRDITSSFAGQPLK